MTLPVFEAFPKIPRLNRTIIISEKIDGTNAQVHVTADGEVFAGSRNRWITPENDNRGFACWVRLHEAELREGLGIGTHYGEWFGAGIQRRYGLLEKRFSLFNTHRWKDGQRPEICGVVPTLYIGQFSQAAIQEALDDLRLHGSKAVPGFMNPEGIVVFMSASATMHKVLLENDELPKGLVPYTEKLALGVSPVGYPVG